MRYALALLLAVQALADVPFSQPRIGPAVGDQSHIRLAVSGDRIFAAWGDNRATRFFNEFTVYASLIDAEGRFLTPEGILVSDGSAPVSHDVEAVGDRFVVAWLARTGVYARLYDRDGKALTPARLLMTTRDRDITDLRADVAVAGSRILVTTGVPSQPLLLLDDELRVLHTITRGMDQVSIASDGTSFLAINRYFSENAMRVATDGRVTVLASNPELDSKGAPRRLIWTGRDYVLVSAEGEFPYKPYAVRYDANGRQLSRQTLSEETVIDADVDLASPGDGSVMATWSEWPYDIHIAQLTAATGRRSFSDASSTERFPALVWTGSSYLVAWTADGELAIAFADRHGNRIGEGQGKLLSVTEQRFASGPRDMPSEWVVWQESDGETSRAWIGNALRPGGTTIARAASDRGGRQTHPRLGSSGDQLLVAWLETNQVFARRFTMAGQPIDAEPIVIAFPHEPDDELYDLAVIWDGSGYLIAYMNGREVWLARLNRFGPMRGPSLVYPERKTRKLDSIALATSGEGSLLVVTERPICEVDCGRFILTIAGVLLDRNGGFADTRLLTIARGRVAQEFPTAADVTWSDGGYIVVWRGVPLSGGDDILYAGRVDANGAVDETPTVLASSRVSDFFMPTIVATSTGVTVASTEWPGKLLILKLTSQLKVLSATSIAFPESNTRLAVRPDGEPVILYHRLDPTHGVIRAFVF